jgi:hypothetical protein
MYADQTQHDLLNGLNAIKLSARCLDLVQEPRDFDRCLEDIARAAQLCIDTLPADGSPANTDAGSSDAPPT